MCSQSMTFNYCPGQGHLPLTHGATKLMNIGHGLTNLCNHIDQTELVTHHFELTSNIFLWVSLLYTVKTTSIVKTIQLTP